MKTIVNYLKDNKHNWATSKYPNNSQIIEDSINQLIDDIELSDSLYNLNFDFENNLEASEYYIEALDSIPEETVEYFRNGGLLKLLPGGTVPNWYSNRYVQKELTGWTPELDTSKAGNNLTSNELHHKYGTLQGAFDANQAYTSNKNLIGEDLNNYYNSSYAGKSIDDYITGYNNDIHTITNRWLRNNIRYNDQDAASHNLLFKKMYGHRSGDTNNAYDLGYSPTSEQIQGSTTWMRRADNYEKEFNDLTDLEKLLRIHKIGDLGYVYKNADGTIAKLTQEEYDRLNLNPLSPAGPTVVNPNDIRITMDPELEQVKSPLMDRLYKATSRINPYPLARFINTYRTNKKIRELGRTKFGEIHDYDLTDNIRGNLGGYMHEVALGNAIRSNAKNLAKRVVDDLNAANILLEGNNKASEHDAKGKLIHDLATELSTLRANELVRGNAQRHVATLNENSDRAVANTNANRVEDAKVALLLGLVENLWLSYKDYNWQTRDADLNNYDVSKLQNEMETNIQKDPEVVKWRDEYYKAQNDMENIAEWPQGTPEEVEKKSKAMSEARNRLYEAHALFRKATVNAKEAAMNKYWDAVAQIKGVRNRGILARKGAKLKALKKGYRISEDGPVKTRSKDAERFRKRNKDVMDSHHKHLDRISRLIELYTQRAIGK